MHTKSQTVKTKHDLHCLHDAVNVWKLCNWQLHYDAFAHSLYLIKHFLAKQGIPQIYQAPYSQTSCDIPQVEDTAERVQI